MLSLALKWLLRPDVEGGEVNHHADRGGHTKYGIADATDGKKDGMCSGLIIPDTILGGTVATMT
ncbi:glycosyl hydrolase 108 family protein [Aeromonas jandaei]|uniref:glycosyl hydrolase 108 family protein n=1 Tax=Aeromonas jandaei TaxID=650 RepID=UPI001F382920|nr:glycosyl hydrolase 108 family protein [Aeromonas jandaei]